MAESLRREPTPTKPKMKSKTRSGIESLSSNNAALLDLNEIGLKDRSINEKDLSDLIINSLPGIFYLQDHTGKYLRWNKNFEKISGYSKEEIEQMHPLDFFDLRDHEHMREATRRVYKEGYNETEAELLTKSGTRLLYYLNGVAVNYEGKRCLLGSGVDLTGREKAQIEIKENEKKYRSLFEQASDPILITDFSGNFTDVNGSFCKLFGYTKKELLRMNIKSLVCPYELKERPLRNDLLMKGKHLFSARLMVHKDGTVIENRSESEKILVMTVLWESCAM